MPRIHVQIDLIAYYQTSVDTWSLRAAINLLGSRISDTRYTPKGACDSKAGTSGGPSESQPQFEVSRRLPMHGWMMRNGATIICDHFDSCVEGSSARVVCHLSRLDIGAVVGQRRPEQRVWITHLSTAPVVEHAVPCNTACSCGPTPNWHWQCAPNPSPVPRFEVPCLTSPRQSALLVQFPQ